MADMREIPLVGGPVEFRGALDLERGAAGVLPRRLPAWTDFATLMPAGVRLAFRTEADVLELQILTVVRHLDGAPAPLSPGVVDLWVDGRAAGSADVPVASVLRPPHARAEERFVPGVPGTVRFAGLPGHLKEIELWLPQQTPCELVALRERPGPAARADRPPPLGAPRKLDQPLRARRLADRHLARDHGRDRRCRGGQPRLRRQRDARPVRRPYDPRPAGRPDQHQDGCEHRRRGRVHAAGVRPGARLPRHRTGRASGHAAAGGLADLPDEVHPNAAGYRRIGERFAALAFGPGGAFQ